MACSYRLASYFQARASRFKPPLLCTFHESSHLPAVTGSSTAALLLPFSALTGPPGCKAALISEDVTLTRKTNNIVTLLISVIAFTQPRLTELSRGPRAALSSSACQTVSGRNSRCVHISSLLLSYFCFSDFILYVCFCFFYCECRVMTCISCQCRG